MLIVNGRVVETATEHLAFLRSIHSWQDVRSGQIRKILFTREIQALIDLDNQVRHADESPLENLLGCLGLESVRLNVLSRLERIKNFTPPTNHFPKIDLETRLALVKKLSLLIKQPVLNEQDVARSRSAATPMQVLVGQDVTNLVTYSKDWMDRVSRRFTIETGKNALNSQDIAVMREILNYLGFGPHSVILDGQVYIFEIRPTRDGIVLTPSLRNPVAFTPRELWRLVEIAQQMNRKMPDQAQNYPIVLRSALSTQTLYKLSFQDDRLGVEEDHALIDGHSLVGHSSAPADARFVEYSDSPLRANPFVNRDACDGQGKPVFDERGHRKKERVLLGAQIFQSLEIDRHVYASATPVAFLNDVSLNGQAAFSATTNAISSGLSFMGVMPRLMP